MFFNRSKLSKYGRVEEENDMIKVYVKKNIGYNHNILLPGIQNGKRIRYLFYDIKFGDETIIDGLNCDLIFHNCTFTESINIKNAYFIQLKNNRYVFYGYANNYVNLNGHTILIEDNFINESKVKEYDKPFVKININGESVIIENSFVCSEYSGNIGINSKIISLKNSTISSPYVYLNSAYFYNDESMIKALKEIKIDNSNCSFTCAIKSPVTIYNDIKLNTSNSEMIDLNKDKLELLKARIQLLNTLHKVEMNCNRKNDDTLTDMQRELNERKITKVLKKDK